MSAAVQPLKDLSSKKISFWLEVINSYVGFLLGISLPSALSKTDDYFQIVPIFLGACCRDTIDEWLDHRLGKQVGVRKLCRAESRGNSCVDTGTVMSQSSMVTVREVSPLLQMILACIYSFLTLADF